MTKVRVLLGTLQPFHAGQAFGCSHCPPGPVAGCWQEPPQSSGGAGGPPSGVVLRGAQPAAWFLVISVGGRQ